MVDRPRRLHERCVQLERGAQRLLGLASAPPLLPAVHRTKQRHWDESIWKGELAEVRHEEHEPDRQGQRRVPAQAQHAAEAHVVPDAFGTLERVLRDEHRVQRAHRSAGERAELCQTALAQRLPAADLVGALGPAPAEHQAHRASRGQLLAGSGGTRTFGVGRRRDVKGAQARPANDPAGDEQSGGHGRPGPPRRPVAGDRIGRLRR